MIKNTRSIAVGIAITATSFSVPAMAQQVHVMPSLEEMMRQSSGQPQQQAQPSRPSETLQTPQQVQAARIEREAEINKRQAAYDRQRDIDAERGRRIWEKEQREVARQVEKEREEYREREEKRLKELRREARRFLKNDKIKQIKPRRQPKTLPPNSTDY